MRKREALRRFRRWEQLARRALSELVRIGNEIDAEIQTPKYLELPGVDDMYLKKFVYEYYLDILNGGNDEAKFELYKRTAHGIN